MLRGPRSTTDPPVLSRPTYVSDTMILHHWKDHRYHLFKHLGGQSEAAGNGEGQEGVCTSNLSLSSNRRRMRRISGSDHLAIRLSGYDGAVEMVHADIGRI